MSDFQDHDANPNRQCVARSALICLTALVALCATTANADSHTMHWWWLTIDGLDHTRPNDTIAWHGRLMVVAWSVFAPIGVLVARFYKVTPKQPYPTQLDNQFWWITHQLLQYGCALLTGIAVYLVVQYLPEAPAASFASSLHSFAGWTLCGLCVVQIVSAWLRGSKGGPVDINAWPNSPVMPGDHYDVTRRRVVFEAVHVVVGYSTIALAFITSLLGLLASNAPRWMWASLLAWWILISLRYVQLQRRDTHIRTYQAIWGSAPEHPGNRLTKVNDNTASRADAR